MRAYQLPDKEWIDLDHVQAISSMWRNCGNYWVYHHCGLTLAFQKDKKQITLSSFSDYGKYGKERELLENINLSVAERNYEDLLTAWSGKAQ